MTTLLQYQIEQALPSPSPSISNKSVPRLVTKAYPFDRFSEEGELTGHYRRYIRLVHSRSPSEQAVYVHLLRSVVSDPEDFFKKFVPP